MQNMYALKHLSQIHASPEPIGLAAHFVLLSAGVKPPKTGRHKLTDCEGFYFFEGFFQEGVIAKCRQGNVTFKGVETKSAHINGTDGDIYVYTFFGL